MLREEVPDDAELEIVAAELGCPLERLVAERDKFAAYQAAAPAFFAPTPGGVDLERRLGGDLLGERWEKMRPSGDAARRWRTKSDMSSSA